MGSEKIDNIIDSFSKAGEFLQTKHLVKESHSINPKWPDVYIYTDGASKGSRKSRDRRSFSGWGVYTRSVHTDGAVKEYIANGNLFNSDSEEAELKAVYAALSSLKIPGRIRIISDCSYVIKGLCEIDDIVKKKEAIESMNPNDQKKWHFNEYRLLNLWADIKNLIQSSKVLSLEVEWIRSHTLDNEEDLPDPSMAKDEKEKAIIMNSIGNFQADKLANLGAKKAIRGALYFLHTEKNEIKLSRSIDTCCKNFSLSSFARDEAVEYLSGKEKSFLPRDVMRSIFDNRTLHLIDEGQNNTEAKREEAERIRKAEAHKNVQITPLPQSMIFVQNEDAIEKFKRKFGKHLSISHDKP